MKRYDHLEVTVTDKLRSYGAAMKTIGNAEWQKTGLWKSNRVENSHLAFRRSEKVMLRFHQMLILQKFVTVHSLIFNHLNHKISLSK